MRQLKDVMDLRPLLIGTLVDNAATAIGNSVDTQGFADILVICQYAVVGGTADAQGRLTFRFQEGDAAASTGGDMTDITNGAIMGSMKVQTSYGTALTFPFLASTCFYERLRLANDGAARKRYIRPIAQLDGTSGTLFNYAISVLLGRPYDSDLIQRAEIFSSNAAEFTLPQWEGA